MLKVVRSHNKSIYSPCKVESTYIFFQKKKLGTLKNFLEILPTEKVDWTRIWNWKYLQKKWWIYEKTVRVLSFMTLMSLVNLVIVFNQYEFCMDLRVPDFWDTTVSLSVDPLCMDVGPPPPLYILCGEDHPKEWLMGWRLELDRMPGTDLSWTVGSFQSYASFTYLTESLVYPPRN